MPADPKDVMTPSELFISNYEASTGGSGVFTLSQWSVVRLYGEDRTIFLHNMCTNEIKALPSGKCCEAFFTDVKGKILAHAIVLIFDEYLELLTVPGQAEGIIAHLERYIIREDVKLEDQSDKICWSLVFGKQSEKINNSSQLAFPTNMLETPSYLVPASAEEIAKGSGMIYPNMATTLGYIFTDATLSSSVLNDVLKNNIKTTFNAISCDGDTSTNDMVSIFSTSKVNHSEIKKYSDSKLKNFNKAVHDVLLNLAKQVVSDGEGASKFISINCINCRTEKDAKNISFKIANSLLVKTAIAGEDPNWGRVAMAIGNSDSKINEQKLSISFGPYKIYHKGSLYKSYDEEKVMEYMKGKSIEIEVDIGQGVKKFKSYTMDLTKKYIEINADYRT